MLSTRERRGGVKHKRKRKLTRENEEKKKIEWKLSNNNKCE